MSDPTIGQLLSSGTGHLFSYSKNLYDSVKAMDTTHIKHLASQSKQLYESAKAIDNSSLSQLAKYSKGVYEVIKTVENVNPLVVSGISFTAGYAAGYAFGARDCNEDQKELERVKEERNHYKELAETGPIRKFLKSKL